MSAANQNHLRWEFLVTDEMLEGPGAAICDLLKLLNQLAQGRGPAGSRTLLHWSWRHSDGRVLRRPGASPASRALPDVVVISGWAARNGPHLNRLVRSASPACSRLRAVQAAGGQLLGFYTGVALLGEAGLLEGRQTVVPWPFITSVLRHAPNLQLAEASPWIEDTGVWSADSPTLATEVAMALLHQVWNADLVTAARSVVLPSPQRQRLVQALARDKDSRIGPGVLERARRWLEDHLHEPYSLAATARAAATSERSLLRHFSLSFGCTPLQMLHSMRVTRARMLLESTYLPVETVAERCGWRDPAMLRSVFKAAVGLTPAAYRERFTLRTERKRWGSDLPRARSES